MIQRHLLDLIGSFSDLGLRSRTAKELARALDAEDVLILTSDPVLDVLLPAPGFPQTLPQGRKWKEFVRKSVEEGQTTGVLVSPYTQMSVATHGLRAADGSLLVLLGGDPNLALAREILGLIPLVVSALEIERGTLIAKSEFETENLYLERAKVLTNALEETRRGLESELRKSSNILNSITDAFFALDAQWKIIEMNTHAEKLFKLKRNEALGRSIWDIYPQVVGSPFHQRYLEAVETQRSQIFDFYFPSLDAWFEVRAYPALDSLAIYFNDISERKKTTEELQQAMADLQAERGRLEAILQQMPEGVIIADPSGKVILRNVQMEVMLNALGESGTADYNAYQGFTPEGQAYGPQDWPLARSLASGEVIQGEEIEFVGRKGNRSILSVSSAPIRDHENRIVAGVVIHHNVTLAKSIESDLRYQSYLNRTITDNAASALFMMDQQGHPTFMNPAAQKITGYGSLEEIAGRPLHYAVHWKKPDGTHYPMEECPIDNAQAELKHVQNQEEIFCSKDGRLFPVSYSISPLEKNGVVVGSVLEFRDITEQKEVEAKLHQAISDRDLSLETLSTINSVGRQITAELDLEKLVQKVTDEATRLTGAQFGAFFYKSSDSEGNAFLLNVVSGVSKEEFEKFPDPRTTEVFLPTFQGTGTIRSPDITKDPRYGRSAPHYGPPPGHLSVRSYLAVSVISGSGEVIGGLFFGHPSENVFTEQAERIVEGMAAQAAVAMDNARLYQKVQESVRIREEFLSIASHELKTPLTSLKIQAQMRKRIVQAGELKLSVEALKKMFETDDRQINRLTRLVDDMLDISRITMGKLELRPEQFDLCELVRAVTEENRQQIESSTSPLSIRCETPVVGVWDKFRIEQVFTNLLTNAFKYGLGSPIEVTVKSQGEWALLAVRDHGQGIAKGNQSRIFERFERAISANEVSGIGLGLFIVKQIVDMHGGSIEVESELGQGARFIVRLPASM